MENEKHQLNQANPESHLPKRKKKSRGKKNWQSMGFNTFLEYKQHLAKEKENEEKTI